jgi:hypothetical protein
MTELRTPEYSGAGHDAPAVIPENDRARLVWLRGRIRQLPESRQLVRPLGKMPLGSRVLVLKGLADKDWGQVAIVSRIAGSLVEISYRGCTGDIETRRKQVSSLIRLQEGLELFTGDDGLPLIRQMQVEGIVDSGNVVSDADE